MNMLTRRSLLKALGLTAAVGAAGAGLAGCSKGDGPAHENPSQAAAELKAYLVRTLDELGELSGEELRAQRHARFRAF